MKKAVWVFAVLLLFVYHASNASASAKSGFGVNLGVASNSMTGTFTDPPRTDYSYSSSGLSLGIDYQFALNEFFSINPFLMSSSEGVSGDLGSGIRAGHGIFGLQARYWINDLFVGAHIASYSEVLSSSSNSRETSVSGGGGGIGLVAGWESPVGGLFVMGQVDSAGIKYANSDNKLNGFRLSVGYRWK